jgi:Cu/Ag efflux protein CusF
MRPITVLIAAGIVMSLTLIVHAAPDAAAASSNIPLAAPDAGANTRAVETLRGVVASVDERNDSITLRLPSDVSTVLKVRDGLLFNAVRYGDQVEVRVENVDGARTIVGLR